MPKTYSTVNGIKLNTSVDEATRKQISRAGGVEQQVLEADRLGVLDQKHYELVVRAINTRRIEELFMTIWFPTSTAAWLKFGTLLLDALR